MTFDFSDLGTYPGSRERRQTVAPLAAPVVDDVLGPGTIYVVDGREVEFYMIGQLAAALGRKPGTLRKWEAEGILPPSGYLKPSHDPRGIRRLYTKQQVLGIIQVAKDTGVMYSHGTLAEFGSRVKELFDELRGVR